MSVKLQAQREVDHRKLFTLFFALLLLFILLLVFLNDLSIFPVNGWLHRPPSLEIQYLLDLFLDILIFLNLQELLLHFQHVLKLEFGV